MSISNALTLLRKEMNDALEFDENLAAITTGSIAVDYITGINGFPRGRLSEVFGWESSGKTTLCLCAAANAQRKGLTVGYLDMERAVNLLWATQIGFDYKDDSKGIFATPGNFEEAARAIEIMAEADVDLIICDSVPAMTPKAQMDGDIEEQGGIGLQSRLMAKFLSRITKTIHDHQNALVFVNQMRAKINTERGSQYEPKEQSAGGSALKFYGSLRIDMELVKKIDEEEINIFSNQKKKVPVAGLHRAHAFKNKVATPYRMCEFYIKYGKDGVYGVDNLQTVIDMSKSKGIITTGGGGYFKFNGASGEMVVRGTEELYRRLGSDHELRKEVRELLNKALAQDASSNP